MILEVGDYVSFDSLLDEEDIIYGKVIHKDVRRYIVTVEYLSKFGIATIEIEFDEIQDVGMSKEEITEMEYILLVS
jgi:hypothetical protein